MKKKAFHWTVGVLVALVWTIGVLGEAAAQSYGDLVEDARGYEDRVKTLERQYLKPAILESRFQLESRFNDARVAYMMEDYDKASLLFVDVVRDPNFDAFASRREALYLLGDSLYERRNYLAAKKYFQQLVDSGEGERYQDAVVRLLQIAAETGNYDDVDQLYDRFDADREMGPGVHYMRGKTLYKGGDSDKAVTFFNRAAESDEWNYKARYFKGVALADQGDFEAAREVFSGLADDLEGARSREETELLHLSYLALGRVFYEERKIERAIDSYQRLPRDSEHFDQALYELTWVLVSRENYKEASRNADIFLYMTDPDPTFIPEVKLLKADLLLRMEEYERSRIAYREVIDQFGPLKEKVEAFLDEKTDVKAFFAGLVEREFEGEDPDYLPKTAQKWVDRSETMDEVRMSVEDLNRLHEDLEQTQQALSEIQARVNSGSAVESFPELAEGMAVAIETEHQLLRFRRELLNREYDILKPKMSEAEKSEWTKLREDLRAFQDQYEKIPKTREEVRKRKAKISGKFEKLQEQIDSIAFMIKGQKEQLENIQKYIRDEHDGELPPEKRSEVEALEMEVKNNIKALREREKQVRNEIARTRQKVGLGDEVTRREREMRAKYREKLERRRQFLSDMHDRVGSGDREKLRKIERARNQLPPASSRLQAFFDKMRDIVGEKTGELQTKLERERKALVERKHRLEQLMKRSKEEASKAAYNNYVRVAQKFDEILMRGDVGLIDIVWQRKENRTDELNQLREDRRQALESLQESFKDVR